MGTLWHEATIQSLKNSQEKKFFLIKYLHSQHILKLRLSSSRMYSLDSKKVLAFVIFTSEDSLSGKSKMNHREK